MRYILCLILFLLAGCDGRENVDSRILRFASPYSPSHPFSKADLRWMKFIEEESSGKIRIDAFWSGSLLSSDHSMEEIRHGVADIGLITPIYAKGGAHLLRIQAGFYSGVTSMDNQTKLYRCMEKSSVQFDRELQGLKVLAVQGGNLPALITRDVAVKNLEDLKGLRLRVPTELLEVFLELGADPVSMPMGEVYSALAKGVIDGVAAPGDTFKSLHFSEVAGHFTQVEIPRGGYPSRAMSRALWDSLHEREQALFEQSISVWEQALQEEISASLQAGLETALEKGVEFHIISAEDQKTFDEVYLKIARKNAASLNKYNIDGLRVFNVARESVVPGNRISCKGTGK
ncbi:TRAP transporter substrate-binding protein DctP [Emcibacter sp.]|uniref:TRAP transporter substrate-binding protein DctP n=1 Tax=Emcibacter sp. TaxID=1979954 RepID=UPI003A94265A